MPNTANYAAFCVVHMQPYERLQIKLNTTKTIVQVMKSYSLWTFNNVGNAHNVKGKKQGWKFHIQYNQKILKSVYDFRMNRKTELSYVIFLKNYIGG